MDVLIDAIGCLPQEDQASPYTTSSNNNPAHSTYESANTLTPHIRPASSSRPQSHNRPPYRCHLCSRNYERPDHLNRHLKSHENARPHKCSRCPKSFNRADLLNRHEASHDRHTDNSRPRIERGERVAAACQACIQSKSKCQDQKPCLRCVKKGMVCEGGGNISRDDDSSSPSRRESMHFNNNESGVGGGNYLDSHAELDRFQGNNLGSNVVELNTGSGQHFSHPLTNGNKTGSGFYTDTSTTNDANEFFNDSFQDLTYLSGHSQFSHGVGFMPQDSYFSQDLDFGMWDIDLDSVELAYQSNGSQTEDPNHLLTKSPKYHQKDVSKRFAAFERSPWLWTPTQKDQALNDQENLNLDEDSIPSVLTPDSPAATASDFSSCFIDSRVRDKMLALLFIVRKMPTQVPSFPSMGLLNSIIQVYFVQENFRIDQIVHSATFDSKKALPHLLVAIVSAGSTLISTPAIWKLGLALQEVVRNCVGDFFEQDNSHTRNLQALQAYLTSLDVGLWSGFKRKMEIAESFGQPIIIMLRRAGAFAPTRNSTAFIPQRSDSTTALETKWRKWVEKESWKRLVLHLFMHDIHASIGFQKPPLISFTELKFSLPASRDLWLAKSASEWRDRYQSYSVSKSISTVSLMDAMQTPDLLVRCSTPIDTHLSAITILHGFWGQTWSLLESKKFYPPSKATHRLCLLTSYTELYRDLVAFSCLLPSLTRNSAEATLVAELLMMILHASPEDLQRFAGKFGEDEARKASAEFTEWSKLIESRIAIWHAGQVFRAAKRLGQAQCRGFNAIAVYYASLTLWIYGLMTLASRLPSTMTSAARLSEERIVLNEVDNTKTRSWRSSDNGIPGIKITALDGSEQFVPVDDTDSILRHGREVYKDNFGTSGTEGSVPPLVDNLGNLLRDLGSLPGSRGSRDPSEVAGQL